MAETKKATTVKPATEKKPAARKTADAPVVEKKPAARKPAAAKAIEAAAVEKFDAQKAAAPKTDASKKEKADAPAVQAKIQNATYATGKRKDSVARVYLALGRGEITVNGRAMAEYFKRRVLQLIVEQPFAAANVSGRYDVRAKVSGGGLSGQAGAVKHGISKALSIADSGLRPILRKGGFLTRDSRVVERKHFGHHKARRSTQYSKR